MLIIVPDPFIPVGIGGTGGGFMGGIADRGGIGAIGGTGATGGIGGTGGTGGKVVTGGGTDIDGIEGIVGSVGIEDIGGMGGGGTVFIGVAVLGIVVLNVGLQNVGPRLGGAVPILAVENVGTFLLLSCTEVAAVTMLGAGLLKVGAVVAMFGLPLIAELGGGPDRLEFAGGISKFAVSKRLRLSSIIFCISVLLLSNNDTFEPLMLPPVRIIPSLASSSVAKTMKASPCSPPTICTPPSGIVNPEKKWRMSMVPATIGRPCKRMTTAMLS